MEVGCGKLRETREEASFDWTIPGFLSLPGEPGICRWSPNFPLSDTCWHLQILPNGDRDTKCKGWIGLYLWRSDSGPPKALSFTLGVRKADGGEEVLCEQQVQAFAAFGPVNFLKRRELLRRQSELAPEGELTVTCTLSSNEKHPLDVSLFSRLWKLSRCWKDVLENEDNSDVVLRLKNREIPAHSVVLEARSTVFECMLARDVRWSKTRVVELVDQDTDTFKIALSYIYCGEPVGLDSENACAVYKTAYRCDLQELKKLCCMFIEKNLSVDSICEVIELSDSHGEIELKESAKYYFANNVGEIVKTEKWKILKIKNPATASELLECALMGKVCS